MSERIMKVLANVAQGLTEEEKLQARTNIGAIGGVKVADSSGTTELVPDEDGKVTVDLTDVGNVPSFSGSDNGLVLGVVGSSDPELQWVSKGGGGTSYTAGDGIDIDANDVISAKVDGTSIGVNASGELESLATVDQHYDASSTNAQSGTAVAEAVSGVSGVPSVGSGDDGKVLTANYTGGSGTFSWQDPPAQEQADWAQTNTSAVDFIKNKPTINNVPAVSSSDDGKVLTADYTGGVGSYSWVTPSGGSTYTAGNGISIANDTISAKVDGSSITVNSSGELQATASSLQTKPLVAGSGITLTASASDVTISADSQLPSYSSADSGKSLVVNGNGDGLTWDRKISGVMYNGASSSELRHIRLNTYNNPSTPGLVAAFPTSGQGASCGFLMPDPGFVADETVDKVARIIENPNNSGVCMLEYQDDAAVISPLEKVSISTSTNPYQIDAEPGKWYEIVCSQSTAQSWHIYLEANSTVTKNTVHTIVRITRTDASISCSPKLVWHDERGVIHYEQCDLTGTTSYYDFDCLVRKNGYTVEGTPWSFARVRRI